MNEPTSTPRLDAIVMTPEFAAELVGWAIGCNDGEAKVLGAALSVFLGEEVACEIAEGSEGFTTATIRIYGPEMAARADEICDFVLAMQCAGGSACIDRVLIDVRMFRDRHQSS